MSIQKIVDPQKKSLLKLLWKHNFSIHELVGPQNFEITLVFPQSCHFGDFNTLSFSAVLGDHCLCRLRGFSCSQCNESHPVTELDEIRLCDVVQRFLQALKWGPFLDGGISSSYPTGWASFVWCFGEIWNAGACKFLWTTLFIWRHPVCPGHRLRMGVPGGSMIIGDVLGDVKACENL